MTLTATFERIATEVSNWGRWGPEDQLGTLNLISPDAIRAAGALIHEGRAISLALPLDENGPQTGLVPGRVNPLHSMVQQSVPITGDPTDVCCNDDVVYMALQAATHWDALSHVSYGGTFYNGHSADRITARGAEVCDISQVSSIGGRGVLLDVARHLGVERLEGAHLITPELLDATAEGQGVEVRSGDILLIRTGHLQLLRAGEKEQYFAPSPGPGMASAQWFREKDIAAVATDTLCFEVWPCEEEMLLPVHALDLVYIGLTQGQNFDLEELASACASDERFDFFLSAQPEPFVGGVGAPTNPVAFR